MGRMKEVLREQKEKKPPTDATSANGMLSTYQEHFIQYGKVKRVQLAKPTRSHDQELISGHFPNNLQVNGKLLKTKTWPNMLPHTEDYQHFLKRFECCWNDIYKMYYACPPVAQNVIDSMLKNLYKTVYQMSYSPNTFLSRNELRRSVFRNKEPNTIKFEETTYRFYCNQILKLENFRDLVRTVYKNRDNKDELKARLRKIYRCGRSTYHDTLSVPAKILAKPTLPGPLDRYALRKV